MEEFALTTSIIFSSMESLARESSLAKSSTFSFALANEVSNARFLSFSRTSKSTCISRLISLFSMWRNRPFYTGSRAVCHHLKSSGKLRSSNSIKPVVRRVSRRISMNQNYTDRHAQNGTHEGAHNNDYNTRKFVQT